MLENYFLDRYYYKRRPFIIIIIIIFLEHPVGDLNKLPSLAKNKKTKSFFSLKKKRREKINVKGTVKCAADKDSDARKVFPFCYALPISQKAFFILLYSSP